MQKKNLYLKESFTLVEMLIVIVIIGILASALIPRLISIQVRSRDTKRKVDMVTIDKALRIYASDNNRYPRAVNSVTSCSDDQNCHIYSAQTTTWIDGLT